MSVRFFFGTNVWLTLDAPVFVPVYPFTVGLTGYSVNGAAVQTMWSAGDAIGSSFHRITMDSGTQAVACESDEGGAGSKGTAQTGGATYAVDQWWFLIARFISASERRIAAIGPRNSTVFQANNTNFVTITPTRIALGVNSRSSADDHLDGAIADYWITDTDIGVAGADLPDWLVHQLRLGGPFSVPYIGARVQNYLPLRRGPAGLTTQPATGIVQDQVGEQYNRDRINVWKTVSSTGSAAPGPVPGIPPLFRPYWYRQPPTWRDRRSLAGRSMLGALLASGGPPPQDLTATLHTNASTFPTHAVTQVGQIAVGLFTNASTFFGALVGANQTLAPSLTTNAQTFFAPTVDLTGLIQIVDKVTGGSTGLPVTLTFNVALQPGDVVYVFGGLNVNTLSTQVATPAGYTQIAYKAGAFPSFQLSFGCWRKVMGAVPDTSVTIGPVTGSNCGEAYAAYVLRGVNATPEDVSATLAFATTGAADSPSITTLSNGALVLSLVGASVDDATVTVPSGYADQIAKNQNAVSPITIGGAAKAVTAAGAENPGAYSNISSGHWVGVTVAVRPAVSLNKTLDVPLHINDTVFFAVSVRLDQTLAPSLHVNVTHQFAGDVGISLGLNAARFTNASTFNAHAITATRTLTAARFDNVSVLFAPSLATTYALAAPLVTNAQNFFGHTLASVWTIAPSKFTNPNAIPVALDGAVTTRNTLTPARFDNETVFFDHLLVGGGVSINFIIKHTNASTFFGASLAQQPVLLPSLAVNDTTFFGVDVAVGARTLAAGLFTDSDTIFVPIVVVVGGTALAPSLHVNAPSFFGATVGTEIRMPRLTNASDFFTHTVTLENGLAAARFDNASSFFGPTVTRGPVELLFFLPHTNESLFFGAALASQLTASRFDNDTSFFAHTLTRADVSFGLFVNDNLFGEPVIDTGAALVRFLVRFNNETVFFSGARIGSPRRPAAPRGGVFAHVNKIRNNVSHETIRSN